MPRRALGAVDGRVPRQFWIELLGAGVRFATGVLSLTVIFGNVDTINGWSQASAGVPVGVLTTVPAQVLLGVFSLPMLSAVSVLAVGGLGATSLVFRAGLRRYTSASS